jgi:NAD(P)-dependent dehydrogenase (short-subunit alcohol dehydrogenase family)
MKVDPPVAIVTGGSRRVGRSIVEDLSAHGWAVAIHYNHSGNEAEALAASIRKQGGMATTIAADLADPACAEDVVSAAEGALGKAQLLVNNASIFEEDEAGSLSLDLYHRQMTVNLTSPIFLAQAFANALPEGREGNIVNIIDQRVWRPTPRFFSYHLAKAALWSATQTLAQAWAPRIRVNAIGPGPTVRNERQTEEVFRKQTEAVLLGHGPELAEFGRTVRYFVYNRSVTGQMVALDGGQHLNWQTPDNADFDG